MLRQMAYGALHSPALRAMTEDSERVAGRELSGLQRRRGSWSTVSEAALLSCRRSMWRREGGAGRVARTILA